MTPLQMAVMMATVANGGHLVTRTWCAERHAAARARGRRVGGDARLRQGRARGGGQRGRHRRRARLADARVAGKTGTVQVIAQETRIDSAQLAFEHRDHAWFASFAPVEDPRLVVVVFVEHGGHGSGGGADRQAPL